MTRSSLRSRYSAGEESIGPVCPTTGGCEDRGVPREPAVVVGAAIVRHGRVLAFRSATLDGDAEELDGIPITTVPRILLDLARIGISDRAWFGI